MVLVAVTGPVGAGKTSLLSEFAVWLSNNGRRADGFLAIPSERKQPGHGANGYSLLWLSSAVQRTFVVRNESSSPPYRFLDEALHEASAWASSLSLQEPLSVVVLDEFGPLEGSGGGHMTYWPSIVAAKPEVVVISVRSSAIPAVQTQIGRPFDVVIDARDSTAGDRLRAVVVQHADWATIGAFGGAAGGFEASVGSMLHGASVPMRGLFLSTVQSIVMFTAGERISNRREVVWVPFISAGIKALSPAGNRLRPMLAITMQGVLFALSVTLFGWNLFGVSVGAFAVGAWAVAQTIILQWVFVGSDVLLALDVVVQRLADTLQLSSPSMAALMVAWSLLWGAVEALIAGWMWRTRNRHASRLLAALERNRGRIAWSPYQPSRREAVWRGLGDLARVQFWAPLLLIAGILIVSGSALEATVWVVVRAVVVAWVLFSAVRLIDIRKVVAWLRERGAWGPALALRKALETKDDSNTPPRDPL